MPALTTVQKKVLDAQAVENFREYLRIPSVHPDIDYGTFNILTLCKLYDNFFRALR